MLAVFRDHPGDKMCLIQEGRELRDFWGKTLHCGGCFFAGQRLWLGCLAFWRRIVFG